MVYYRKYRPQKIEDLDSKQVRDTLSSVLCLPEVPHAFLFTGPKGLGKTSTARILAKAVNCEKVSHLEGKKVRGSAIEPCNECDACTSITNGTSLDVLEIDAASNRGIDEIRDLREKIKLTPIAVRKKVYIIDEVHMLTTEAFNALLKTLEEPPAHAMFILCTTELHKVPATILSRCFHVIFQPATKDDIARSFTRIIQGEGLTIEDGAIEEIATLADGGFRDAHKILEELVSMDEKVITRELVEKRYKVVSSREYVEKIIDSFQERDPQSGLAIIQIVIEQKIDLKQFALQLTEKIHQLLLLKAGVSVIDNLNISTKLTLEELRELLIVLQKATYDMKYAVIPQLPLELAVIEWSVVRNPDKQESTVAIKKNEVKIVKNIDQVNNKSNSEKTEITVTSMRKQVGDIARVKALYGEPKKETDDSQKVPVFKDFSLLNISNTEITKEWLSNFWDVYIGEIKQYNHTLAGVLRSCTIDTFNKETFKIQTAYKFHKERLDEAKAREVLEKVCKTLTGNSIKVEVILKGK